MRSGPLDKPMEFYWTLYTVAWATSGDIWYAALTAGTDERFGLYFSPCKWYSEKKINLQFINNYITLKKNMYKYIYKFGSTFASFFMRYNTFTEY